MVFRPHRAPRGRDLTAVLVTSRRSGSRRCALIGRTRLIQEWMLRSVCCRGAQVSDQVIRGYRRSLWGICGASEYPLLRGGRLYAEKPASRSAALNLVMEALVHPVPLTEHVDLGPRCLSIRFAACPGCRAPGCRGAVATDNRAPSRRYARFQSQPWWSWMAPRGDCTGAT
jgi:hypothetical protein